MTAPADAEGARSEAHREAGAALARMYALAGATPEAAEAARGVASAMAVLSSAAFWHGYAAAGRVAT